MLSQLHTKAVISTIVRTFNHKSINVIWQNDLTTASLVLTFAEDGHSLYLNSDKLYITETPGFHRHSKITSFGYKAMTNQWQLT